MSSPPADEKRIRRYPGVRSFEDQPAERNLFFGRDDEIYELMQLIRAERLVVLFARSGVGKSSIINAGLMQPLRDQGMFPIVARVSMAANDPLESFYRGVGAALKAAIDSREVDQFEPGDPNEWNRTTLWHFFKSVYIWRNESDEPLRPVIIFDQFEELFTLLSPEQRRPFVEQLADLVRGIRPGESIRERRATDAELGDSPPDVRIVLAIREDFMANLEEMAERIPAILKTRFRLSPLSSEQAGVAIKNPAGATLENAETAPFEWSDETLEAVLNFLRRRKGDGGRSEIGDEVEPFQLQLVCQFAEDLVRDRGLETIEIADLGGEEGLQVILSCFYRDAIDKISSQFRRFGLKRRLRSICEYGLITESGGRLLREESTIRKENGISGEVLSAMVECRLIRKETRLGDNYFELTHDTLIDPILDSRRQSESRRNRLVIGAFSALVLIAGVSGIAGWNHVSNDRAAEKQRRAEELIEYGRQWGHEGRPDLAVAFYSAARAFDSVYGGGEPGDTATERERVDLWMEEQKQDSIAATKIEEARNRATAVVKESLESAETMVGFFRSNSDPVTLQADLEGLVETVVQTLAELVEVGEVLAAQMHVARADSVFRLVKQQKDTLSQRVRHWNDAGALTFNSGERLTEQANVPAATRRAANRLASAGHAEEALLLLDSLEARFDDPIPATLWNTVCWYGGLVGDPAGVVRACERGVSAAENELTSVEDSPSDFPRPALVLEERRGVLAQARDSRGLVRTLVQVNPEGAKADFRAYAEAARAGWLRRTSIDIDRREAWSTDLTRLSQATLDSLRNNEMNALARAEQDLVRVYVPAPDEEGSLINLLEAWVASSPTILDHLRESPSPQCEGPHSPPIDSLVWKECDRLWDEGEVQERILNNACSARLTELMESVGFLEEVFITDALGYNVCVAGEPTDYYQEDEPWWRNARKWEVDPTGTRRSQIDRDQSVDGRVVTYQVYTTVRDPDSNEFLGVIKGAFDPALVRRSVVLPTR